MNHPVDVRSQKGVRSESLPKERLHRLVGDKDYRSDQSEAKLLEHGMEMIPPRF